MFWKFLDPGFLKRWSGEPAKSVRENKQKPQSLRQVLNKNVNMPFLGYFELVIWLLFFKKIICITIIFCVVFKCNDRMSFPPSTAIVCHPVFIFHFL